MTKPDTWEWRYTTSTARVAHALSRVDGQVAYTAECGQTPPFFGDWHGTGSQAEYERAAELPPCKRCAAKIGMEVAA